MESDKLWKEIQDMPMVSSGDWECPKCHSHNIVLAKASKKSAKMMCSDCGFKGSAANF